MKAKTGELLNLLLWSADKLGRPTFRNLTGSYESWAYRNGFFKQVRTLENEKLLERNIDSAGDRLVRLTSLGRLHALGGRDPQRCWSQDWDGRWRLVLFDVPTTHNTQRARLRRYLRARGFGCLQNSVWVSADSLKFERQILNAGKINVESLIFLEARPCSGESDAEIVAGAWDFRSINSRYAHHLRVLDDRPAGALHGEKTSKALLRWAAIERQAWLDAVAGDPLLPERLLPADYLGQQVWRRRVEVLREAGKQLRTFVG